MVTIYNEKLIFLIYLLKLKCKCKLYILKSFLLLYTEYIPTLTSSVQYSHVTLVLRYHTYTDVW